MNSAIIEDCVRLHATLDGLLRVHQIGGDVVRLIVAAGRTAFNPHTVAGRTAVPNRRHARRVVPAFEYAIDHDRFLRIAGPEHGAPEELIAEILLYPKPAYGGHQRSF